MMYKQLLAAFVFVVGTAGFAGAEVPDTVMIDHAACRALVRHQPADDVTYKPGVDVHGKPVVEADINAAPITIPETVRFNITVDVAKYAGIHVPEGTEMQANMGTVEVLPDGKMTFNGQPMAGDAEAALVAICKEQADNKAKNGQKPSLQKRPDIIYNR